MMSLPSMAFAMTTERPGPMKKVPGGIDEGSKLYKSNGIIQYAQTLVTEYSRVRRMLEGIFLGTPSRFQSADAVEGQIHQLLQLPGPEIADGVFTKVRHLACQVKEVNRDFLAAKLFDRVSIYSVFIQHRMVDEPTVTKPFPPDAHFDEKSFEDIGRLIRTQTSHVDLVRGGQDSDYEWQSVVSESLNTRKHFAKSTDELFKNLQRGIETLIESRNVYEVFRPKLEDMCRDAPEMTPIILNWLGSYHRGKPTAEIEEKISELSPPTAERVVHVFISSLVPHIRQRAETVFNWIKHAPEPWSPASLTEAIAVYELNDQEPCFEDLSTEDTMHEIANMFGGIITIKCGDIRFSHPSFYHVPEIGVTGTAKARAARVNGTIAKTCLRYFQLKGAQKVLAKLSPENLEGGAWKSLADAAMISHPRTSMAEYAVRFWPYHYRASDQFRPSAFAHALFSNKDARASWNVPFWLLSNPFSRSQQSYTSPLPVFAMLGLKDLVDEEIRVKNGRPSFEKNCWLAIAEAARTGNKTVVQKLLENVAADEEGLQAALLSGASRGDAGILDVLVEKIPDLRTFKWPEEMIYRAAAAGLDKLVMTILSSGCDINMAGSYWGAPLLTIAIWKNHASLTELLLKSETKPDLTLEAATGDNGIATAVRVGNPSMIEVLVRSGARLDTRSDHKRLLLIAVQSGRPKALEALLAAGVDFQGGEEGTVPLLLEAAQRGDRKCVRVLLNHGADPSVEDDGTTALYKAVVNNREGTARLLLEHEPKPNMDAVPPRQDTLMIQAVCTRNPDLASLLIQHGAKVDFIDPNGHFCKTPLSRACKEGDVAMVKLLLDKGASVNYTGGVSDAPLFTALYENKVDVARYLLQHHDVDIHWKETATD
ncbi:ankyrin repeat-containing domain protein [Hypoxylon sp. FL1284]|nr:ankyrin repeat-containing domain protein [Hypoxylon sp. FL1284]